MTSAEDFETVPEMEFRCMVCCTSKQEVFSSESDLDQQQYSPTGDPISILKDFSQRFLSLAKLELEENDSLCRSCSLQLSSALVTKSSVDVIETRVRSLQLSLLRELMELQKSLNVLEGQFKVIEDSVRKKNEPTGDTCTVKANCSNLQYFQEQILSVAGELRSFQAGLTTRFSKEPAYQGQLNDEESSTIVKVEVEEEPNSAASDWLDDFVHKSSKTSKSGKRRQPQQKPIRKKAKPKATANSRTISSSKPKPARAPRNTRKAAKMLETFAIEDDFCDASQSPSYSTFVEEGSYQVDPDPLPEGETETGSTRKRRSCSSKTLMKMKRACLTDGRNEEEDFYETGAIENAGGDSDDDGDDDEYKPKVKTPYKYRRNSKPQDYVDPLEQVDFTGMSQFKKYTIALLLKSVVYVVNEEDYEGLTPDSPEYLLQKIADEKKRTIFEYNPENGGKVHLKGIEVKIDEEAKNVQCSLCTTTLEIGWPVISPVKDLKQRKKKFREHLLQHFTGYQCPFCPKYKDPKRLPHQFTYVRYMEHLKNHKTKKAFVCHICPSGFKNRYYLERHILTHKSREERDAARIEKEMIPKENLCQYCPKSFKSEVSLRTHLTINHPEKDSGFKKEDKEKSYSTYSEHRTTIPLHRKLQILEYHRKHPKCSFRSLHHRFRELKSFNSLYRWKKQLSTLITAGDSSASAATVTASTSSDAGVTTTTTTAGNEEGAAMTSNENQVDSMINEVIG